MKERIKNYWYSLGDSTRAIIKVGSVMSLITLFVFGSLLWEIFLVILVFAIAVASLCFFIYVGYTLTKWGEEERSIRYSERKAHEEYLKRLKEGYEH